VEELVDLAGNLGVELTEQDGERAFSVLDANGSGMVDFDEFFAFYGAHPLVPRSWSIALCHVMLYTPIYVLTASCADLRFALRRGASQQPG